jgi:hypothetical protein
MFSRDLEPYCYGVSAPLKDVVSIGWLSSTSSYPRGRPTIEVVDALGQLLSSHRVLKTRGYHECEFCLWRRPWRQSPLTYETRSGKKITLGSAEIWVPSSNSAVIYAAPDLIYHYVKEHRYLPPSEFVNAVLTARDNPSWNADAECEKRLEAALRP